jgi:hypothetical protein
MASGTAVAKSGRDERREANAHRLAERARSIAGFSIAMAISL